MSYNTPTICLYRHNNTSLCYLLFRVTDYTNKIASLEQQANQNLITTAMKNVEIDKVIEHVEQGQTNGMLLFMTILPLIMLLASYFLYVKYYKLDEERYAEIVQELEARK